MKDLPSHLKDVVHGYVYEGLRPGHFLTCVITNDLFGAVARADENSAQYLTHIVKYFYNKLPGKCYGSKERMEEWLSMNELERKEATRHFDGTRK